MLLLLFFLITVVLCIMCQSNATVNDDKDYFGGLP